MKGMSEFQFEEVFKHHVKKYRLASTNAKRLFDTLKGYGVLKIKEE